MRRPRLLLLLTLMLSMLPILSLLPATVMAAGTEESPPAELACLARHYSVRSERANGAWAAVLPDGRRIPWDDGKNKTYGEKLAAPDVKDMFSIPYRTGPIRPVDIENDDPGRIRADAIFAATYPTGAGQLVKVEFFGTRLTVHRKIVEPLARTAARLARAVAADPSLAPFFHHLGGTYARRVIAGTDRVSTHSYAIAIDISTDLTTYWRWQRAAAPLKWENRVPQAIVDAFEAEGFIWGGRWYHYDTMHFEYRPELLDAACRAAK